MALTQRRKDAEGAKKWQKNGGRKIRQEAKSLGQNDCALIFQRSLHDLRSPPARFKALPSWIDKRYVGR
jgi:hypothetical protein